MRSALIIGAAGQDGRLLARLLLDREYAVRGWIRSEPTTPAPCECALIDTLQPALVEAELRRDPPDEIYYPMRQLGRPGMLVVGRTAGDPAALQGALRRAVAAVDQEQPISLFTTLDTNVANSLGVQRIVSTLTAIFAALGLAVYGHKKVLLGAIVLLLLGIVIIMLRRFRRISRG